MAKTLYVNYDEWHESGGGICSGDENSSWPSYEPSYNGFSLRAITLENTSPYHEEFKWEGPVPDSAYVVVVRYYDGDTFSSTHGKGAIEAVVATEEEANQLAVEIRHGKHSRRGYTPWDGYFAGLEDVEVHHVIVKD